MIRLVVLAVIVATVFGNFILRCTEPYGYLFTYILGASISSRMIPMPNERIVGGKDTTIEENPWQIAMLYFGSYRCGGSVISHNTIVTSAVCINEASVQWVSIRAGSSYRQSGGSIVQINRMVQHERFDMARLNYDIGLLFLADSLEFGPTIQPIALPSQGYRVPPGTYSTTSGWGLLKPGQELYPNVLQIVASPIVGYDVCQTVSGPGGIVDETMICAGYYRQGGAGTCVGDYGGPLVIDGTLQGIVSWGYGCAAPGILDVDTRVSTFVDWINDHVTK